MNSILVVEDDGETRDTIAGLLGEEGYAVRTASDGVEALEQMRQDTVDLALVDLLMPGMNGWDLIETMSSDPVLSAIPVLATTALMRDELPSTVQVLRKPFELATLLDIIREAVRRADAGTISGVRQRDTGPGPAKARSGCHELPKVRELAGARRYRT
jgi:CheY-like chemotaxis protein